MALNVAAALGVEDLSVGCAWVAEELRAAARVAGGVGGRRREVCVCVGVFCSLTDRFAYIPWLLSQYSFCVALRNDSATPAALPRGSIGERMSAPAQRPSADRPRPLGQIGSKVDKRSTRETRPHGRTRVLAVLITLFAVFNLDEVKVSWVFGSGKAPLIVVIVISVLVGIVLTYFAERLQRKAPLTSAALFAGASPAR